MAVSHMYVFSDASPSDWLTAGDDEWHTIANFVFQSDPALQPPIDEGATHEVVLAKDAQFVDLISNLEARLPSRRLRKWNTRGRYKPRFCAAFETVPQDCPPVISGRSFQEKTLKASKSALLASYNRHIGGVEGRGIGFEEFIDSKGRRQMKHGFMTLNGLQELQAPEDQMLVLLLTAWLLADQFKFYLQQPAFPPGFNNLRFTVVSDKLSGDDTFRRKSEQSLRNLIDPEAQLNPLTLTRSARSDMFSADLLVDNLAGWMTAAIKDPDSDHRRRARELIPTGVWAGWHELLPSIETLKATPATVRLLTSE